MGIKTKMIDMVPGFKPQTFKSALIALESGDLSIFLKSFEGTIQWTGKSMGRRSSQIFTDKSFQVRLPAKEAIQQCLRV